MASSLQSKVQTLAVLFSVFILLAVPLFAQVMNDAREARPKAKETLFFKWGNDIRKFLGDDPGDITIDEFDQWRQQAEQNGCPPTECGPTGDLDGDGRTNEYEFNNRGEGWNPNCNEEEKGAGDAEKGKQVCAGVEPVPTEPPPPPVEVVPAFSRVLYRGNLSQQNNPQDAFQVTVPSDGNGYYDRWIVYSNLTGLTGTALSYQLMLRANTDGVAYCCDNENLNPPNQRSDNQVYVLNETESPQGLPPPSDYSVEVTLQGLENSAIWSITIVGIRDAFERPAESNG